MDDCLDPEAISAALSNDHDFVADNTPSTLAVYARLARELPCILAEQLGESLTFSALARAKIAVVRHFLKNGYVEALAEAIPDNQLVSITRPEIVSTMYRVMPMCIWTFEKVADDLVGWLRAHGATEDEMLRNPKHGRLNPEAVRSYQAGTLTIGRLIGIQPSVFIKNNSDL
jgi:hypothetical protein